MNTFFKEANALARVRELQAAGQTVRLLRETINFRVAGGSRRTIVQYYVEVVAS
jgi:hypothetical protein